MGKAASTTLKPSDVNTDGQNQVLQITIKRGKDDTSRAKPPPGLQLEVDLGDIVSPCIDVMFICSDWGSKYINIKRNISNEYIKRQNQGSLLRI